MISHCWFDMDHTLIDNDCDVSWKHFMVGKNLADAGETERLAALYYQKYLDGTLDPAEFMAFQLCEFRGQTPEAMNLLAREHFEVMVKSKIYRAAAELCRRRAAQGCSLAVITSTNTVVARPLADWLGIETVFGAQPELFNGRYTGKTTGVYPVGPGKVAVFEDYWRRCHENPKNFAYYGDSIHDRFLLAAVGEAHAVNPGSELRNLAEKNHWHIDLFN